MFIIVPLSLIIISIIGIIVIVVQKMPYLKKLSPDSHEVGDTILHDLFPEIINWGRSINFKEYRRSLLRETEKLLRRLRVATMKVDHASDSLIKRIRKNHLEHEALQQEQKAQEALPDESNSLVISPELELKNKEQQLIIEIAKNPKDVNLYNTLGDLYMTMHNIEEAKESYEAALGLDPHNEDLIRKYSQFLKK